MSSCSFRAAVGHLALLIVLTLAGCGEVLMEPAARRGPLNASIAPGSITTTVLATPVGVPLTAEAVSEEGTIFGRGSGTLPQALYAWNPYSAQPIVVDADGMVNGGGSNDLGDVLGWKANGPDGAWLKTGPSSWSFVATPMAGFKDASPGEINNAREMAITVALPGYAGFDAWRGAYMPAPGATPVVLPLPGTLSNSWAVALNNAGDIAGYAYETVGSGKNATTLQRPVFWRRTGPATWTAELLPNPAPTQSGSARAVNDAGQVAGIAGYSVVRWSPSGSSWTIATFATTGGSAPRIDACGRMAGTTGSGAYVWDGTLTTLPWPSGAQSTGAADIGRDSASGLGVVVGAAEVGKGRHTTRMPVRWTIPACP